MTNLTPQHSLIYTANELGKTLDNISRVHPTTPSIQAICSTLQDLWLGLDLIIPAARKSQLIIPETLTSPTPSPDEPVTND